LGVTMHHDICIKTIRASDYANLILLNRTYSMLERRRWFKVRKEFLAEQLIKTGNLTCFYCNRNDLTIEGPKSAATVDHIIPKSSGGKEFDKENFAVCCFSCNSKKGSATKESFEAGRYLTIKKKHINNP